MFSGIRDRLTYANVMATIAVFIALGGVGWAAATITSKDVVDDSLKSVDLRNDKGVKGADVVDGSLKTSDLSFGLGANGTTETDQLSPELDTWTTVATTSMQLHTLVAVFGVVETRDVGGDQQATNADLRLVHNGDPVTGVFTENVGEGTTELAAIVTPVKLDPGLQTFNLQVRIDNDAEINDRSLAGIIVPQAPSQ